MAIAVAPVVFSRNAEKAIFPKVATPIDRNY